MLGNPLCIKLCAVLNKIFEKFVFKLGGLVLLTGPGLFFLYPALLRSVPAAQFVNGIEKKNNSFNHFAADRLKSTRQVCCLGSLISNETVIKTSQKYCSKFGLSGVPTVLVPAICKPTMILIPVDLA